MADDRNAEGRLIDAATWPPAPPPPTLVELAQSTGDLVEFGIDDSDPVRQFWGPVSVGPVNPNGLGRDLSSLARADGGGNLVWHPILLAQAVIPSGTWGRVRGIRQYASIGAVKAIDAGGSYPVERQVTSPAWSFPDGGLRWHVTRRLTDSGISGPFIGGLPYMGLGTFYDIRFPWISTDLAFNAPIKAREVIEMWLEVLQPSAPGDADHVELGGPTGIFAPEDDFVMAVPNAVWRRAAGRLIVELFNENTR